MMVWEGTEVACHDGVGGYWGGFLLPSSGSWDQST